MTDEANCHQCHRLVCVCDYSTAPPAADLPGLVAEIEAEIKALAAPCFFSSNPDYKQGLVDGLNNGMRKGVRYEVRRIAAEAREKVLTAGIERL